LIIMTDPAAASSGNSGGSTEQGNEVLVEQEANSPIEQSTHVGNKV